MNYYVYSLGDPETGKVCYIGCTKRPETRLLAHLHVSKHGSRKRVCEWLRGLQERGRKPVMAILKEFGSLGEARAEERRQIRARVDLLNVNGHGRSAPKVKEQEPEIEPVKGLRANWWKEPEVQRRMMLGKSRHWS